MNQVSFWWNYTEIFWGLVLQGLNTWKEAEFLLYVFCWESCIPKKTDKIGRGTVWTSIYWCWCSNPRCRWQIYLSVQWWVSELLGKYVLSSLVFLLCSDWNIFRLICKSSHRMYLLQFVWCLCTCCMLQGFHRDFNAIKLIMNKYETILLYLFGKLEDSLWRA